MHSNQTWFSPRPWGWSVLSDTDSHPCGVLPTPVGMVRVNDGALNEKDCSPHARGDGPNFRISSERSLSKQPAVLPTPVGMVRQQLTS